MARRKVKEFEALARTMAGDGKSPNVFFVSLEGAQVMITTSFSLAYKTWNALTAANRNRETCLEDRQNGTVCSQAYCEERKQWEQDDSSNMVRKAAKSK